MATGNTSQQVRSSSMPIYGSTLVLSCM